MRPSLSPAPSAAAVCPNPESGCTGVLIINADDWGRDRANTDRTRECVQRRTVSSVSAMVFMEDSERAADVARDHGIDAGLHLNFTAPFLAPPGHSGLVEHQRRLSNYLLRHRYAQVVFHPGLRNSFEYVVLTQLEEFCRLYGTAPGRLDGHHHQHLCANVLLGRLLPAGTIVRRNFTFRPGQKKLWNRLYRQGVDGILARRHRLTDCLFSLPPLDPSRLQRIFNLARQSVLELETHPVNPDEYRFLMGGEILRQAGNLQIASGFAMPESRRVGDTNR